MIIAVAAVLLITIAATRLLPTPRLSPTSGIALCLTGLAARTAVALAAALALVTYVPEIKPFQLATNWCFHAVLPYISAHIGLSGHRLGETATLIPIALLAVSLIAAVLGLRGGARALSRWLAESAIGPGPCQSLIVGGPDVLVAAAGLHRARVVVSAGALMVLDEDELEASLAHERAHIGRRHPYLSLAGTLLLAVGRVVPGGAKTQAELQFHLERDADEEAVRCHGDPLALAAAICKAGRNSSPAPAPLMAGLARCAVPARLQLLIDRNAAVPDRTATLIAGVLAFAMGIGAVALIFAAGALGAGHIALLTDHGQLPLCNR